jgi:hypothetical protein
MSTDSNPPKPMPSADEINAYLELSAARTKLRLPLAKGAALVGAMAPAEPAAEKTEKPPLPVSGSKKLPTQREQPSHAEGKPAPTGHADVSSGEVWRPFSSDDER